MTFSFLLWLSPVNLAILHTNTTVTNISAVTCSPKQMNECAYQYFFLRNTELVHSTVQNKITTIKSTLGILLLSQQNIKFKSYFNNTAINMQKKGDGKGS